MIINNSMLSKSYNSIISEKNFLKLYEKNAYQNNDTFINSDKESLGFSYQSKSANRNLSLNYIINRFIKRNKEINKYNKNILVLKQINDKFRFSRNYIKKFIEKKKNTYIPTQSSRNLKKLKNKKEENLRKYRILMNIRKIIQRVEYKLYYEKRHIKIFDLRNIFHYKKILFKKNRKKKYIINKILTIDNKLNRIKDNKRYLNLQNIDMMNRNNEIYCKDNSFQSKIKNKYEHINEKHKGKKKKKKKIEEKIILNSSNIEKIKRSIKNKSIIDELKRNNKFSSFSDKYKNSSDNSQKKQKEKKIYIENKDFKKYHLKYTNDDNIFNKNRIKRKTYSNNKTIQSFQNSSSEYETCPYVSEYINSNKLLHLNKEERKSKLKSEYMNMFYDNILPSNMINLDIDKNEKYYYSSKKLNSNDNTKDIYFNYDKNIPFNEYKSMSENKNIDINNMKHNSYYYVCKNEVKKIKGNIEGNIYNYSFCNDEINLLNQNVLEKSNKYNNSFYNKKNQYYEDYKPGKNKNVLFKKNIYEERYNANNHSNNVLLKFKSLSNGSDDYKLDHIKFIKNVSKNENNKLSDSYIYKYNFNYPSFHINVSNSENKVKEAINVKKNFFSNCKSYLNKNIKLSSSYMNYHSNKCISDSYCEQDIYFSKRENRLLVPFTSLKNYNDEYLPSYYEDSTHFENERKVFFDSIRNIICIMKEVKKIKKNLEEQRRYYSIIDDDEKKKDFIDLIEYLKYQKAIRRELKKYYFDKINKCLFTFLLRSNHFNFSFSEDEVLLLKQWNKLRYQKSKKKNSYVKINSEDKIVKRERSENKKIINNLHNMKTSLSYKNNISTSNNCLIRENTEKINKNIINNNIKEEINSDKLNNKKLLSPLKTYINKINANNYSLDKGNKKNNNIPYESSFKFCERNKTNVFDIFLFLKNIKLKNIQNKFKKKLKNQCIYLSKINDYNKMLSYIKYIFIKLLKKEVSNIVRVHINDCFINSTICFFLSLLLFIFKNVHTIKIIRCHLYYSHFIIFLNYFKNNNLKHIHFICNNIVSDKIVDIDNYNKYNKNFIIYFNTNYINKKNNKNKKKVGEHINMNNNIINDVFENSLKKKVSKIINKKNNSSFYDKNKIIFKNRKDVIFFDCYGFYDYFTIKQKKKKIISRFTDDLKNEYFHKTSLNKENIENRENILTGLRREEYNNNSDNKINYINTKEILNNSKELDKWELSNVSETYNEKKKELTDLSNPLEINKDIDNKNPKNEYYEINTYNIHSSSCSEENNSEDSLQELNECVSTFSRKALDYLDLNKIKILKLCSNKLNDNALMYISTLIKKNKLNNMKILDLRWNNFTYKSLLTLSFALTNMVKNDSNSKNSKKLKLRKLLLSGNNINSSLYSSFLSSFCTCNFVVVKTLDFSMNKIDNESFPITYKYFKHILQLSKNRKHKNNIHDVFINLDHNNLKNSVYINKLINLLKKFPIKNYKQKELKCHKSSKDQHILLSLQYNNIKNMNTYETYESSKERIKI
ncbi:conserved Plasmodium protein, unknown function [Plasmodium gallinaceum]|uniref:Uncharacterized protein n=1 Tax=Plasmodium gallinaceum TaxID=5849 RepID=A0A1J1GSF9_PLAGA|nr:conserved Plasmodium protein, unknown function [Plasmodium gallinaceum]CRG94248.1 conserved Plasmodium protein, unknown function [Plasmodium gallinaceum]